VPLVLVCLVLGGVFWTIFLRDRGGQPTVPAGRIEQHRAAVESCLARADLACARIALMDMQRELPGEENWRDLQVRMTTLEAKLAKQSEPERPNRAPASATAPAPTNAPASVHNEVAQAPPAPASAPDRAAQVDAASRERAPVRYPPDAMRTGARGTVVLTVDVAEDGTATALSVTRSSRERSLDRAALEAARRWRYLPAIRDGRTYASTMQLEVNFSPDAGNASDMADLRQPDNSYPPRAPTIAPPPAAAPEAGLLNKARVELQQGRYDVAVALGESALQVNPDSAAARSLIRQAKAERDRVMRETTIE
jgi:TonB family protein